jgi:hypothetical protein
MLLAKIPFWKRILPHVLGLIAAIGFFYFWSETGQVLFKSLECLGHTPEECVYQTGPGRIFFVIQAVFLSQFASYLVVWYLTKLALGTTRRQRRNRELKN